MNDRVRITVKLIHGPCDMHIWSKRYERDLRDVMALQHEIATDIAREVRVTLGPQEQAHLARAWEVIPEVHEAYHERCLRTSERERELGVEATETRLRRCAYSPSVDRLRNLSSWPYSLQQLYDRVARANRKS